MIEKLLAKAYRIFFTYIVISSHKKTEHIAVPGLSFYFLGALYNELDSAFLSGVNALVKNATPPNTKHIAMMPVMPCAPKV